MGIHCSIDVPLLDDSPQGVLPGKGVRTFIWVAYNRHSCKNCLDHSVWKSVVDFLGSPDVGIAVLNVGIAVLNVEIRDQAVNSKDFRCLVALCFARSVYLCDAERVNQIQQGRMLLKRGTLQTTYAILLPCTRLVVEQIQR